MSCPDFFRGSLHEGTPRGKIIKLYGPGTYVNDPSSNRPAKGIIVIIPDAFGLPFSNNQLLADHYARRVTTGYNLPDFIADLGVLVYRLVSTKFLWMLYALLPWYFVNRIGASYPRVKGFFEALRRANLEIPIGAERFCWGGKHIILLARRQGIYTVV